MRGNIGVCFKAACFLFQCNAKYNALNGINIACREGP